MIDYCNVEKDIPEDWHRYHAALDGAILQSCIEADVNEGRAVCFVRDDGGELVMDEGTLTLKRETKTGAVEIIHDDDLEVWQHAQKG